MGRKKTQTKTDSEIALAKAIKRELCPHFAPYVFRDPVEYAANTKVPDGTGGFTRMRFDRVPYQRQPYLDLFEEGLRDVVLRWFSRGGKTRIVTTAIGYHMEEDPTMMAVMYPSMSKAAEFKKTTLQQQLINCNPSLLELVGDGSNRRNTQNTIHRVGYNGQTLRMLSAGSPGDIRQASARIIYSDEIDAIETEKTDEGDQIQQLDKRRDEFEFSKLILTSYPSIVGLSKIDVRMENSDCQRWHVQHQCGHEYVMHWDQCDWREGSPQKAVLLCPKCGDAINDKQRLEMMLGGEWRPTREFKGIRGYDANSTLWPWPVDLKAKPGGYIQIYAERVEAAQRSDNPSRSLRVICNHEHAESYEEDGSARPEKHVLMELREDYDPRREIPHQVVTIGAAMDVQADRIEFEVVGFGENKVSWGLGYHVIQGKYYKPSFWAELHDVFAGLKYNHPDFGEMGLDFLCVDAGWKPDQIIPRLRDWSRARTFAKGRIWPLKGSNSVDDPLFRMTKDRKKRALMLAGVNECKDIVWQRFNLTPNDEADNPDDLYPVGYPHIPRLPCYDDHWYRMLVESEDASQELGKDGNYHARFKPKELGGKKARNEAIDIRGYLVAGEARMRTNYKRMRQKLLETAGMEKDTVKEEEEEEVRTRRPTPQASIPRRKKNFVTGY